MSLIIFKASSSSIIVKFLEKPLNESSSIRKNLAQKLWKVETHICLTSSLVKFSILSFISLAALLVKVTAKIFPGIIPKSRIK